MNICQGLFERLQANIELEIIVPNQRNNAGIFHEAPDPGAELPDKFSVVVHGPHEAVRG